jgi:hypothetical protein
VVPLGVRVRVSSAAQNVKALNIQGFFSFMPKQCHDLTLLQHDLFAVVLRVLFVLFEADRKLKNVETKATVGGMFSSSTKTFSQKIETINLGFGVGIRL